MLVTAVTGTRQAALVEKPMPRVKDNFALVKIHTAPMCTEYKAYQHGWAGDSLGHEAAGEVVEIQRPGRVQVGDRVVVMPQTPCGRCELCQTGDYIHCEHTFDPLAYCGSPSGSATYAQYCIKQDWQLLPIPDGMSYEHASLACCGLGPTFSAAERMRVDRFDTVLVTGLGPVGLGAVINAVYRGARVIAADPEPYRTDLARALGAVETLDPTAADALEQLRTLTRGRGADKTIECSAVTPAQQFALAATRRRGEVAFVGWGGHFEIDNMVPQGLTLHGIWHWNLSLAPRMFQMIAQTAPLLDRQITHTFPLSRVQEAWELQLTGQCGKVLLDPWR